MKRLLILLILLLSSFSLFAVSFGWGASGSGQAGLDEGTSFNTFFLFDFTNSEYFVAETSFRLGFGEDATYGFEGFTASLYTSPIQILNNPFNFLFAEDTKYAPKIEAGIMTSRELDLYYNITLSPLHFSGAHFSYDILSPYCYFDSSFNYAGWGIELVKVVYFL